MSDGERGSDLNFYTSNNKHNCTINWHCRRSICSLRLLCLFLDYLNRDREVCSFLCHRKFKRDCLLYFHMGNRSGSSRSKSRDNKYKYPNPYHHPNNPSNKNGYNQRIYSSQFNGYSQPPYSNGYDAQLMSNPSVQYPITSAHYSQQNTNTYSKSHSNKVIYVANYDFTGTAASGELSFVKGDRLEILDRYT